VVIFTLWPLSHQGQSLHYPLNRRLGGPWSWSEWLEEEEEEEALLPLLGMER